MTGPASPRDSSAEDRSVPELVFDVSERVSVLVREEVELAKTEVREKLTKLIRGSIVGIVAGIFAIAGLAMLIHGIAWLLNDLFFSDHVWIGFVIEAAFWLVVAGVAGFVALRAMRAGAPPTPDLAIEEARRTKETLEAGAR
jgi:uncharacterized membrane protein YqjE